MPSPGEPRLGWALVGIGHHAEQFVAPALRATESAEFVAVYSRDAERGRAFAERHGARHAYDALEALLEDPAVDAVFLCSPNHVHEEQVLRCAAAGKQVLCEKPLSADIQECQRMLAACQHAGVKLGVGFHLRHNPVHARLRELARTGTIGDLVSADMQYFHKTAGAEARRELPAWRKDPALSGGGRFQGTGLHAVDLLRYATGLEITEIMALADAGWAETGWERSITAALRLGPTATASLASGPVRYPFNALTLYGTEGTLRASSSVGNYGGGILELVTESGTQRFDFEPSDVYVAEIDAFAEAVRQGTEPNASGLDGLRVAQISAAVYQSLRARGLVRLDYATAAAS